MLTAELKSGKRTFPPISKCDLTSVSHSSIAADLDGTLLKSSFSFPYYILIAIEAGSLLRGLILLLSLPIVATSYLFLSEDLSRKMLIFISFSGIKVRDIEIASRGVLPRFYAADVRSDSFEVFDRCQRKVVVTANPIVLVDVFVKEYLGGEKVLGTEIEVNPKTKRATGFVKEPGFLVGRRKKLAIEKEFGENLPDIGIGDRKSDHDFMSICKNSYTVPKDNTVTLVSPDRLKTRSNFHDGRLVQRSSIMSLIRGSLNLPPLGGLIRYVFYQKVVPVARKTRK